MPYGSSCWQSKCMGTPTHPSFQSKNLRSTRTTVWSFQREMPNKLIFAAPQPNFRQSTFAFCQAFLLGQRETPNKTIIGVPPPKFRQATILFCQAFLLGQRETPSKIIVGIPRPSLRWSTIFFIFNFKGLQRISKHVHGTQGVALKRTSWYEKTMRNL